MASSVKPQSLPTPPPIEPVDLSRLDHSNTTEFTLGPRRLRLRKHPTRMWLHNLSTQSFHRIIPGMLDRDDQGYVQALLVDRRTSFDVSDVQRIARVVTTEVTGFPWYVAVRLSHLTTTAWTLLDAMVLLKGIDLLEMPVRRSLAIVYALHREAATDNEDRTALDRDLWALPDGEKPAWTPVQQAASFAAFRAMRSSITGRTPNHIAP